MSQKRTLLALAIIGLSTGLLGCATRPAPPPRPVEVPVAVMLREEPPADLLACAERPVGLPISGQAGTIRPEARKALERVFPAFGANASRLDRLVN